ncbi:MAG: methyltransferase family protein [Candidatus Levyibacteriota bacterium]
MQKDPKSFIINGITFVASIFILLSGPLLAQSLVHLLMQILGILIIIWSVLAKNANKTKDGHTLPSDYFFVTTGPYEIVRHPIYLGYLFFMMGSVEDTFTFLRVIAFVILISMIAVKIVREEHKMIREVKAYQTYRMKTKAIIPFFL